jgi:hypothetical protein
MAVRWLYDSNEDGLLDLLMFGVRQNRNMSELRFPDLSFNITYNECSERTR